jgi:hypothetical protein
VLRCGSGKQERSTHTPQHDGRSQRILGTPILPEGRSERAYELFTGSVQLADDLLEQSPTAILGDKGGKQTAKRGSEYFRQLAAKRKTHAGGRSRAKSKPNECKSAIMFMCNEHLASERNQSKSTGPLWRALGKLRFT